MFCKILNNEELKEFNELYGKDAFLVMIKKTNDRYYINIDVSKYIRISEDLALKFLEK